MRSLTVALLVILAFAPVGCKRRKAPLPQTMEDAPPELAATVHMNDPKAAEQLISGFHQIENKAWRWTAREFVLVLRPPAGSAQLGAALQAHLTVPAVVIDKLTKVSLTSSIGGTALTTETYTKPGDYLYQTDVPPSLLRGGAVKVEFTLDQAIPASATDQRELGVIVSSVGLKLK
jgi:hypothetical protein